MRVVHVHVSSVGQSWDQQQRLQKQRRDVVAMSNCIFNFRLIIVTKFHDHSVEQSHVNENIRHAKEEFLTTWNWFGRTRKEEKHRYNQKTVLHKHQNGSHPCICDFAHTCICPCLGRNLYFRGIFDRDHVHRYTKQRHGKYHRQIQLRGIMQQLWNSRIHPSGGVYMQ